MKPTMMKANSTGSSVTAASMDDDVPTSTAPKPPRGNDSEASIFLTKASLKRALYMAWGLLPDDLQDYAKAEYPEEAVISITNFVRFEQYLKEET